LEKKMKKPETKPKYPIGLSDTIDDPFDYATPHSQLLVKKLHPDAKLPTKHYDDDIGWDLYAFCLNDSARPRSAIISQNGTRKIITNIAVCPPPGYGVFIYSRSGLAGRGVVVANAPGVVDPGYRGDVSVLLHNGGHESCYIKHEDRIAQLILLPIVPFDLIEADDLPPGSRDTAGFGSTGR